LALIGDVAAGRKSRVVLTKRGKVVAALVPLSGKISRKRDPWGALRGTVTIPEGVDITQPAGEAWSR
jgi:antitoxin (DNA-binding transcriptional repressor) of toxin-antitoxin stability system